MDAAEYKHLVLGLIFVKYISDSFAAHRAELTKRFTDENDEYFLPDADEALITAELEERDYYTADNVFWVPVAAREDALKQVEYLDTPVQLVANRALHKLLLNGVPVQYQKDGETRGDLVRLLDWKDPQNNEFWAVSRFTIKGPHHTRRPDIILFVNGLPLLLMELKNSANENADIWKAYDQIQTYKAQIPDIFDYNEILVISDGSEARFGSLSANAERFMQWRTIDGVTLDPLGQFNELETLVRGLLAPQYLLDYLRYFVLFEDDGKLIKKIAGYHQFHAVRFAIEDVVQASRPDAQKNKRGKGGVVWHTQGSGKSITMGNGVKRGYLSMENS